MQVIPQYSFWGLKQEEIALRTGDVGNGSIQDGYGTIVHGLNMDIAKEFIYS